MSFKPVHCAVLLGFFFKKAQRARLMSVICGVFPSFVVLSAEPLSSALIKAQPSGTHLKNKIKRKRRAIPLEF